MTPEGISFRSSLEELSKVNIKKQLETIQNLYIIWREVGIDEEQEIDRAKQVWSYVFELLNDIKNEEASLLMEIKERIKNYEKKISVLNVELQLPKTEKFTGTLIQQEQTLRQLLDELTKKKHQRLREIEDLRLQGLKCSKILGMPSLNFPSTGILAEEDIYQLKEKVKVLQKEKEKRQLEFLELKKELSTILEITELSPKTPLEKEIFSRSHNEDTTLLLNNEKLKELKQIITETKKKQADLENKRVSLVKKLSSLWDALEIDVKEREIFLSRYPDYRISNLDALKREIIQYEEIQKENFSKRVSIFREELQSLWKKCFVVPLENMLPQIQESVADKNILENYDNEVKKWRKYYKDTEHIIQMILKRQELWDEMIAFESKAVDPNRFKNRGGNLLKEEKQRKQLTKLLPELEEKIVINIQMYEKETGNQFLYYGEIFKDFIKRQWEDRVNQKENEKLTKKKMLLEKLKTPSKQSFSIMTPKSTPCKILRSAGASVFKTPNFSVSKQTPFHTPISYLKNKKESTNTTRTSKRNTTKEKNKNKNKLVSECLDSTTYAEFASALNRSSRTNHRSSVLSSKRNTENRISYNKRKYENKSFRKSLRKK